jgi:hypothetical protein
VVTPERVRRVHGRTTEQQRRRNRKPLHRHFSSYTKSCRDEREELRVMPSGESASPGRWSSRLTGWQTLLPFRPTEALRLMETAKNISGLGNSGDGSNRADFRVPVCPKMRAVS